jgi:hypothetical protein
MSTSILHFRSRPGFAGISGPSAIFSGPAEGYDSAVLSAGFSIQWTPTITTYLNYDGQLGRQNYDSNGVTGGGHSLVHAANRREAVEAAARGIRSNLHGRANARDGRI